MFQYLGICASVHLYQEDTIFSITGRNADLSGLYELNIISLRKDYTIGIQLTNFKDTSRDAVERIGNPFNLN